MATTTLTILTPPDYIYVGETLGFTIETDGDITSMVANPTGIVAINADRDKITGLRAGTVEFTIKAQRKGYEEATLVVNLRCLQKKESGTTLRLHNRATNRVSSITAPNTSSLETIVYKLPKTGTGKLVTTEALKEKFSLISTPTIVIPDNGATNVEGWMVSSPFTSNMGFKGELEASIWQYATDKDFNNVIDTRYITRAHPDNDKTKGPIIHSLSTIYARVKFVSDTTESSWSDPVMYTTGYPGNDSLTKITKGDFNLGYFGIISHSDCVSYGRYRGEYDTLIANSLYDFLDGEQVSKDGKLYYATKNLTQTTAVDPTVSVTSGSGEWLIDNRTTIPTIEWVNSVIGIGFGNTDSNVDGLSSGATSIGPMVNKESGWIKYVYKGKLCYTPVKPICTQICWNDIAKREVMYGERTFRCGGLKTSNGETVAPMYRIRLMKEDEYTSLIPALMDGTLASYTQADLGLVDETTPTTARLTWIEDFQEGSKRKVGDHTGKYIYQTDPKTRIGVYPTADGVTKWEMAYRPVIEYVTEVGEPWRNWPVCHEATDENFQYDKYTDTGYYGTVSAGDMHTGNAMADLVGLTGGYAKNSGTVRWLKFYWHGIIYYGASNFVRYGNTPTDFNSLGILYNFDTGDKKTKSITAGSNIKYKLGTPIGSRYTPFVTSSNYKSTTVIPGAYSQHIELFARVFTNSSTTYYNKLLGNAFDGYQVGDNWATTVMDTSFNMLMTPISGTSAATWDPSKTGKYDYGVYSSGSESDLVWVPMMKYAVNDHIWTNSDVVVEDKYTSDVPIITELYVNPTEVYVSGTNKVEILVKSNDTKMKFVNSNPSVFKYNSTTSTITGVTKGEGTLTFTAKYEGSDTITKTVKVYVIDPLTFTVDVDEVTIDYRSTQVLNIVTNGEYTYTTTGDAYFMYTPSTKTITAKAIGTGSITFTATNKAGDTITKTIPINIMEDVTNLSVNVSDVSLNATAVNKDTYSVLVTCNTDYTYAITGGSGVFTFDKTSGVITAVKEGTGVLTFTAKKGNAPSVSKSINVTVKDITTLTVSSSTVNLNHNGTAVLTVNTNAGGYDFTNTGTSYYSFNKANGVITGITGGTGTLVITANKADGSKLTQVVTVNVTDVTTFTVSPTAVTIYEGDSATLTINTNASDYTVTNNYASYFTYDKNTKQITGKAAGSGTLGFSAKKGNGNTVTQNVNVTVNQLVIVEPTFTLDGVAITAGSTIEINSGDTITIVIQ